MKKIAAWTLLALYLNASAQLILPLVSDGVAHLLFWEDHLEHVHHGEVHSHHVAAEMAALGGDDHPHPTAPHPAFAFDKDALSAHVVSPAAAYSGAVAAADRSPQPGGEGRIYQSFPGEVLCPPPNRA